MSYLKLYIIHTRANKQLNAAVHSEAHVLNPKSPKNVSVDVGDADLLSVSGPVG